MKFKCKIYLGSTRVNILKTMILEIENTKYSNENSKLIFHQIFSASYKQLKPPVLKLSI